MLGIEQMRFQNIWMDGQSLEQFPSETLADLAGNAFETTCCSAVVFSLLCLLSEGGRRAPPLPSIVGAPGTDSDDDSD